jgi:hypothetical protein
MRLGVLDVPRGTKATACRIMSGDDHLRLGQAARHDAQDQTSRLSPRGTDFVLNLIAYNLIRVPTLLAA